MTGHTIILDLSDPKEQRILDGFLAEMQTQDRVDLSFHGDRVTLRLGR